MPTKIVVPDLGESVIEATVAQWLKNEGDRVAVGEPIVELETEKVDLEVGAPQDGILNRIEIQAGEDVKVGDVLGLIEDSPAETGEKDGASREEDSTVPSEEHIDEDDDTEKDVSVGTKSESGMQREETPDIEKITPVAKKLVEEHGIEQEKIQGSGPGQRITKKDVENYLETLKPESAEIPESFPRKPISTERDERERTGRLEERKRMSRRRRTIARRLVEAQRTAAMLTTFNDVDMSAVLDMRRRKGEEFEQRHHIKLGIMPFFVKATIAALKTFPQLNAELRGEDNEDLILKYYYDIGIAIGDEDGLVVPVLRNANRMTFPEIERKIVEFVDKAREKKLTIDDLQGGTFTITNGGVFGSLLSTPILNPPQTGILGMHRIEDRPVAVDGEIVIRPMMYLALSYDHRVVDGREAVLFLKRVKQLIEDPAELLLDG